MFSYSGVNSKFVKQLSSLMRRPIVIGEVSYLRLKFYARVLFLVGKGFRFREVCGL